MNDHRPIVYVPCKLMQIDENNNFQTLAYYVSKAHLTAKTTHYYKTTKSNSYEYKIDCDEFPRRTPESECLDNISGWFLPIDSTVEFASKDYKSCKLFVEQKNKELLEDFPESTDETIVARAQMLESVYISEEEMLGIDDEEEKEL